MVRLKKYLYVLRPLLACRWILQHATPPPMLFSCLAEAYLPPDVLALTHALLRAKRESPEAALAPRIEGINAYIEEQFPLVEQAVKNLPTPAPAGWEGLNEMFLRIVLGKGA